MLNQIFCKISLEKYGKNQFMIRVAGSQCNRVSVEMQEGRAVLLVKAENSQPTSSTVTWPHWSGRTAWNRNANLLCWQGPSTLGPHFYVMEKGNLCPGSQITNETCLIIEKFFFFLKQNHLGRLTPHTFCLFGVHLLCSLQLSFPTRTLRTFLREAALLPQTCKASWQPRRKSTKRPIFCRMGLIWHCFCWLLNLLQ